MKKLAALFTGQKLTLKFTIIIFLIVYIPVFVLTNQLLKNTQDTLIKEKMSSVSLEAEQLKATVSKTAEVAEVLAQTFTTHDNLMAYLKRVQNNEAIPTLENINFYRHDISALSKFIYSNAYLYQIRVYADSQTMPEMMPVLYRQSRMRRLKWAEGEKVREGWHFDYVDALFSEFVSTRKQHLMALVKTMVDVDGTAVGVVEASIDMESLLPALFIADDQSLMCLIDQAGNRYYPAATSEPWLNRLNDVLADMPGALKETQHLQVKLGGKQAIVSYIPLPAMSAKLVQITSLDYEISMISRQRVEFYVAMGLGMLLLIVLIHYTVRTLLRRFYLILKTVRSVQQGDLGVRTPIYGQDEIAQMGKQVNRMLDKINILMTENTEREIIMKNTEIRALHNQINAHFIYNVLESIKMMAEVSEHFQIADAVTSLGKLLRYSMRWTKGNVTIEEEIEYIQNYLALINLRFDYQIHLSLSIPDSLMKQQIPKISLQPIVENAIGHGLGDVSADTYIYIKAYEERGLCCIEVTDPGKGMDVQTLQTLTQKIEGAVEPGGGSGPGIGLKNVQDRIRVTFGEQYGLTVQSKLGMFTKVVVTLPIITE